MLPRYLFVLGRYGVVQYFPIALSKDFLVCLFICFAFVCLFVFSSSVLGVEGLNTKIRRLRKYDLITIIIFSLSFQWDYLLFAKFRILSNTENFNVHFKSSYC